MKKLLLTIAILFSSPFIIYSQPEFKIKVEDFLWTENEKNIKKIELIVKLKITNIGNQSGKCEDLYNINISSSNENYKYGSELNFKGFSGFTDQKINPKEFIELFIVYSVPRDADNLNLYLSPELDGDSKFLTVSFYKWKLKNKNYDEYVNLGQYNFKNGKFFDAIISYQKAIIINPELLINFDLGNTWVMIGDYDQAVFCYKKALNENNDNEFVYNNLGYAYFQKSYYDDAVKSFYQSIEINNKNWLAALGAALSFYELKEYRNAEKYYKIGAKIENQLYEGMTGLKILFDQGGFFYTEKQYLCANNLCKYLGYNYF